MKSRLSSLLACTLLLMLTGCSTLPPYVPPGGDPSQYATILKSEQNIGVHLVDDKHAMTAWEFVFNNYPSAVRVTPGKHTIVVTLATQGGGNNMWSLWLVAEPGKRYLLRDEFGENGRVRCWLEDLSDGKAVGGLTGSVDEPEPRTKTP